MFQINSTSNEIVQLAPKSFSELGRDELRMVKFEWRDACGRDHFADVGKMVQKGVTR